MSRFNAGSELALSAATTGTTAADTVAACAGVAARGSASGSDIKLIGLHGQEQVVQTSAVSLNPGVDLVLDLPRPSDLVLEDPNDGPGDRRHSGLSQRVRGIGDDQLPIRIVHPSTGHHIGIRLDK
jgi:hypothetical protein